MESVAFWRDLELRFRALVEVTTPHDQRIQGVPTEVDLQEFPVTLRGQLLDAMAAAIQDPLIPLHTVYTLARQLAHMCRLRADGAYVRQWYILGGAGDPDARRERRGRFRSLARMAAVGADLVATGVSDDEAVDAWLNLLRDRSSYYGAFQRTFDLFSASADRCEALEAEVYQATRSRAKAYKTPLSANLDRFRQECGWTFEEISTVLEISKDTALDHVNAGQRPRPDLLRRYADSFSEKLGRQILVSELDPKT